MYDDQYFADVEAKTNVSKEQILEMARALNGENIKDEAVLRTLIQNISLLTGKHVDKAQEERILRAVREDHFQ